MDIANLRAFVEVASHRSFSKSAEALQISQPAVSKRIAVLEAELSVRLFDRIGGSVLVTEAGRILLPSARQINAEVDRIQEVISNLGENVGGKLTIATSDQVGRQMLPVVLKEFHSTHPDVQLDVRFTDNRSILDSVEFGDVEIGLCETPWPCPAGLLEIDNWIDDLSIVVAKDHVLHAEEYVPLGVLLQCPAVLPAGPSAMRRQIDDKLSRLGSTVGVSVQADAPETVKVMIANGLGWGCLPAYLIDDTVMPINVPELKLEASVSLVSRQGRTLSCAAQAFVSNLRTALAR